VAGAKAQALTLLDLFLDGETVDAAWDYFNDVQTVETEYIPFIAETDQPAIWLNEGIMAQWREQMRPFYYDASRFNSYLEQLGIEYPTVRTVPVSEDGADGDAAPSGDREPEGRGPGGE
jgi:aminobenzoyl-glutamate utilization protein B